MTFGKANAPLRVYTINPKLTTVEQIVRFLSMINVSYGANITLPPEMQELLTDGIIIEKTKPNEG